MGLGYILKHPIRLNGYIVMIYFPFLYSHYTVIIEILKIV